MGVDELGSLAAMARGGTAPDPVRVSREFEALLVGEMLKTGTKPLFESTLFGGSAGRMYQEMFLQEVVQRATLTGGFGLARELEAQLRRAEPEPEAKPK